jgi:putative endonuclease
MKRFIYVFATGERPELIIGCCSDIKKTSAVFKAMPNLSMSHDRLVYCEDLNDEKLASDRMNQIFKMTREEKELLISAVNPNWIELIVGKNFELK